MNTDVAQALFIAATVPLIVGGGMHALYTLVDTRRPTYFAPQERSLTAAMERTGLRFRRRGIGGGDPGRPSMWNAWLGFNISHGLGVFTFGLLALVIAVDDFRLVEDVAALRPLTVAISAVYLAVSLRFWFWGATLITGTATLCFTAAAVLSA